MSSSYVPVEGPGISVVIEGGKRYYLRGGERVESGYLHGGLTRAVSGHGAAERSARKAYRRAVAAALVQATTASCVVTTGLLSSPHDRHRSEATLLVLGCLVAFFVVGRPLEISAEAHRADAINRFNDSIQVELGRVNEE
jgi:hypothetical protein